MLEQIRKEYEAAQLALSGFAYGAGMHQFINQRMENIGKIRDELETIVGDKPASELVVAQLEAIPEKASSPQLL